MISFVLGFTSYFLIEKKFTQKLNVLNIKSMILYPPVILCIFVGAVSSFIYIKSGLPFRVEAKVAEADSQQNNKKPFYSQCFQQAEKGFPERNCFYLSPDKVTKAKHAPSAIVLGDSHASTLIRNIAEVAVRKSDGPMLFYGHQGYFPVQNLKQLNNTDGSCIKYSSYLKSYFWITLKFQ